MAKIKLKAYHRDQRRIMYVTGFMGVGNDMKVFTPEGSMPGKDVDLLLCSLRKDQNGAEIYDQDIVSYILTGKDKKQQKIVIGWIDFKDGCFMFTHEELIKDSEGKTVNAKAIELREWDASKMKVLGNKSTHGVLLQQMK